MDFSDTVLKALLAILPQLTFQTSPNNALKPVSQPGPDVIVSINIGTIPYAQVQNLDAGGIASYVQENMLGTPLTNAIEAALAVTPPA